MGHEYSTPQDAGLRRYAKPEAITVANLGILFTQLGGTCAALARRVDAVTGPERAALFAQLGRELRESADLGHETARIFEDASRGIPRPAHTRTTGGKQMTFKQLWTAIKTAWQSRPFAIILPAGAFAWYFWSHGHDWQHPLNSVPNWQEFLAGSLLLTTKFERLTEFFLGPPSNPPPPIVPKLGLVAILALSMGLMGCKTTAPSDSGTSVPSPVVALGHCTTDALRHTSESIIGDVTTALATGGYVAAVADLVGKFGVDEVGCAVDLIIAELSAKAARTNDTETKVILLHAQDVRSRN